MYSKFINRHCNQPCLPGRPVTAAFIMVSADSAASKSGSSVQQPGKRLSASSGRPQTALSRLAKLAKTSPGMSPGQVLPAQSPQQISTADPLHISTDIGRLPFGDTSNANEVKARGSPCDEVAQEAAQQVEDDIHNMSQQAKQQQLQEGGLHNMVDQNMAGCNANLGGAPRQSQAGVRMLLWCSYLLFVCMRAICTVYRLCHRRCVLKRLTASLCL